MGAWWHDDTSRDEQQLGSDRQSGKAFFYKSDIASSEVTWLGFNYLGHNVDGLRIEGEEADIYVPGLDREQAEAVADKILQRFPSIRPDFSR